LLETSEFARAVAVARVQLNITSQKKDECSMSEGRKQ
jgi:hypothetical protein